MNRYLHVLEPAHAELLALLKELDDLVSSPEAFVKNYFTDLKTEINQRAEAVLEDGDTAKISRSKQAILEVVKQQEAECQREPYKPTSGPDFRNSLETIKRDYHHAKLTDWMAQEALEKLACLKIEIEDEISSVSFELLKQKRFIFVQTNTFGRLVTIDGVNLTDSETAWIK